MTILTSLVALALALSGGPALPDGANQFGTSVVGDNGKLFIGDPAVAARAGRVWVYDVTSESVVARVEARLERGMFGTSLAISEGGKYLAVSSAYRDGGAEISVRSIQDDYKEVLKIADHTPGVRPAGGKGAPVQSFGFVELDPGELWLVYLSGRSSVRAVALGSGTSRVVWTEPDQLRTPACLEVLDQRRGVVLVGRIGRGSMQGAVSVVSVDEGMTIETREGASSSFGSAVARAHGSSDMYFVSAPKTHGHSPSVSVCSLSKRVPLREWQLGTSRPSAGSRLLGVGPDRVLVAAPHAWDEGDERSLCLYRASSGERLGAFSSPVSDTASSVGVSLALVGDLNDDGMSEIAAGGASGVTGIPGSVSILDGSSLALLARVTRDQLDS